MKKIRYALRANSSVTKQVGAEAQQQAAQLHLTVTQQHSLTRSELATVIPVSTAVSPTFSQRSLFTPEKHIRIVTTALQFRVPILLKKTLNGQTSG